MSRVLISHAATVSGIPAGDAGRMHDTIAAAVPGFVLTAATPDGMTVELEHTIGAADAANLARLNEVDATVRRRVNDAVGRHLGATVVWADTMTRQLPA